MSVNITSPLSAWEPVTPRGVAAFAYASLGRLCAVQLVVALLAAIAIAGFLKTNWFPVVREAIRQLPEGGEVRNRQLIWRGAAQIRLAESGFLALSVNLNDNGAMSGAADVQIEFRKKQMRCRSLLGFLPMDYPIGWIIAVDRNSLEPWWGAWELPILVGVLVITVAALFLSWALLATLYFPALYCLSYLRDRELTWAGSWRVAGAALMPGALFFTLGIVIYSLRGIGLVHLGVIFLLHLVIGWVYVFVGPLFLRRSAKVLSTGKNPFAPAPEPRSESKQGPLQT